MSKKYELIGGYGTLTIRAIRDIPRHSVRAGDFGGDVYSEDNLSHEGDCWIELGSFVSKEARVQDNAIVRRKSVISDRVCISGNAVVEKCLAWDDAVITEDSVVTDCIVSAHSIVRGNSRIKGLHLRGSCDLQGNTEIILSNVSLREATRVIDLQGEYNDKNYLLQGPALSTGRYSLAYHRNDGSVKVTTGCFHGTLDQYLSAIEETHKNNPEFLDQYRGFHANFVKHFSE